MDPVGPHDDLPLPRRDVDVRPHDGGEDVEVEHHLERRRRRHLVPREEVPLRHPPAARVAELRPRRDRLLVRRARRVRRARERVALAGGGAGGGRRRLVVGVQAAAAAGGGHFERSSWFLRGGGERWAEIRPLSLLFISADFPTA